MIPQSIRDAYRAQEDLADPLLEELENLFSPRSNKWFYTARKKSLESFYQKIESGKVADPASLEDFVGAMLVVPMLGDLAAALEFIDEFFLVEYRRPPESVETNKKASDFPFDDLRLFGHLRLVDELPPRPIDSVRFEIQVKTFLQHAWAIATHDLVYKYDRVNWARSRVAYQLKAVLEHADVSVSSMAALEASEFLPSRGEPETRVQALIEYIAGEWPEEVLPADRRRQAENVDRLLRSLGYGDIGATARFIRKGRNLVGGAHPDGFSPYECVIEYASLIAPVRLRRALTAPSSTFRLLVSADVLQRIELNPADALNAII